LAYTWHAFSPKCADVRGASDEDRARAASERRSRVSFDIEPLGQLVKLTVVHDGFEPGSTVLESVTRGWTIILASLKALLETGEVLPALPGAVSQTP